MLQVHHALDFISNILFFVIPCVAWENQGYRAGYFYKLITKSARNCESWGLISVWYDQKLMQIFAASKQLGHE